MRPDDMDTDPMAELPAEVKQHMTRYKAPPGLERRIRHMIARESRGPGWRERLHALYASWGPIGASFACGVLVAVSATTLWGTHRDDGQFEQQLVSAHIRSLMPNHLMDVASTDQHTVKPWFNGKLDFSPPVMDLASAGFPLVGGRLDYLHGRAVAVLVYQRRGHVINVFVMPARDERATGPASVLDHGYRIAEWQQAGMRLSAVSDLGRDELDRFAQALQKADPAAVR
jgi:anti-sigma factor RsiW